MERGQRIPTDFGELEKDTPGQHVCVADMVGMDREYGDWHRILVLPDGQDWRKVCAANLIPKSPNLTAV